MADADIAALNTQPQLYDAKGKPLNVSTDRAASAIASGQAGFLKGTKVHVVNQEGKVGTVPSEQAGTALRGGMRLASDTEVEDAQAQAEYGGIGGTLSTAATSALSGLTLGVSDTAIEAAGGAQWLRRHQEANPVTSTVSNLAGAVAPMFAGDEAGAAGAVEGVDALQGVEGAVKGAEELSALAKARQSIGGVGKVLSAPNTGVAKVGGAVERALGRALGAEEGVSGVTGLAKKVLAKGAGAATEAAMIGGVQEINEQAIRGDPELNGEKVLAAMGHGALLGFAAGGALTAGGALGSKILGKVTPRLETLAEEQAARTVGMTKAYAKKVDKIPGGFEGIGRTLLDKDIVKFGDSAETIAPKLEKAREEAGERIGQILEGADKAGFEGPTLKSISDRVEEEIMPKLRRMEKSNSGAIKNVENLMDDFHTFAGIPDAETAAAQGLDRAALMENKRLTFKELQQWRRDLDSHINFNSNPLSPVNERTESAKALRSILESSLEQAGEKAANDMGGSFLKEYRQAKLEYRQLNVAADAAKDAEIRASANRKFSPSDYITGAAITAAHHGAHAAVGAAAGAIAGEAEDVAEGGEGIGGLLKGAALGGLGMLAHHVIRERGNSSAAVLLDKLAALRGVERATAHVDNQIDRGIAGFFREEGRVPPKLKVPLEGERGEHVAETSARRVAEATANNKAHAATINRAAEPLTPHAPVTSNSFQRAALRATMYLANAIPKATVKPSITPQFDKPQLTDAQKADYARQVQAVHDPATVLADMASGRLTRPQVDALKMVYPAIYKEVSDRVHERLLDLKHPLSYAQKVQLSTLLGISADETLSPQFIQNIQHSYAAPGQKPNGGPTAHLERPLKGTASQNTALSIGPKPGR